MTDGLRLDARSGWRKKICHIQSTPKKRLEAASEPICKVYTEAGIQAVAVHNPGYTKAFIE
jgi:hypothetical protein